MKNFKAMILMARSVALGLTASATLMASASAATSGSETKLSVTATILKRANLKVLTEPSSVVVTAADIARGYVDVPVSARLAIQSNSMAGYLLEFASQGDFMRQTLVTGLANDVQLGPEGGVVIQRSTGSGVTRATLALGFRFLLSDSARQGTYSWPMRLSVTPL